MSVYLVQIKRDELKVLGYTKHDEDLTKEKTNALAKDGHCFIDFYDDYTEVLVDTQNKYSKPETGRWLKEAVKVVIMKDILGEYINKL